MWAVNGTRLLGVDPLMLAMWPHDVFLVRDITDAPMLEEFATSLGTGQIVTCPQLEHLASTPAATQLEVAAKAVVDLLRPHLWAADAVPA